MTLVVAPTGAPRVRGTISDERRSKRGRLRSRLRRRKRVRRRVGVRTRQVYDAEHLA